MFSQPVEADNDVLFSDIRHHENHLLLMIPNCHVEDRYLRDRSVSVLCSINVVQRNRPSQLPRLYAIPFYESSVKKLGCGSAVHHCYQVLLSLLANQPYGNVKMLSAMIDFIYERGTQHGVSTVGT